MVTEHQLADKLVKMSALPAPPDMRGEQALGTQGLYSCRMNPVAFGLKSFQEIQGNGYLWPLAGLVWVPTRS